MDLEFLKILQSSEPLHTKMHLILILLGIMGCMVTNPQSFSPNRSSKMRESQQFPFGLRLVRRICETLKPRNPNKNRATLKRIFHQIIVCQPIRRKDSIQTVIRKSRRLDSFLYEAAQKFEVFSKIQK